MRAGLEGAEGRTAAVWRGRSSAGVSSARRDITAPAIIPNLPEELWEGRNQTMLLRQRRVMQTVVEMIISFLFLSLALSDSLY